MIIGNGMLAKAFPEYHDHPNIVIYAAGVSDPQETRIEEFSREKVLILTTLELYPDAKFVYFGTTTHRYTLYRKHKQEMEEIIQSKAKEWIIFKLGPVVSDKYNGKTFYDYVYNKILSGEEFLLWKGQTRPLVQLTDVQLLVRQYLLLPVKNVMISLTGREIPVETIVQSIEQLLQKKAKYTIG